MSIFTAWHDDPTPSLTSHFMLYQHNIECIKVTIWNSKLGTRTLALGPGSMAVIQTVIQNRALADRC